MPRQLNPASHTGITCNTAAISGYVFTGADRLNRNRYIFEDGFGAVESQRAPGRLPTVAPAAPALAPGLQFAEGDIRVGETAGIDREPGADQCLNVVVHVPDVDVHPGYYRAVGQPERDELQ
jgi:hypothetical protein